jgi:excisionase family DNA binding protein
MTDSAPVPDDDLTLQAAAELLGVHYMTAYRYVRTGQLPAVQVDSKWHVRRSDLARIGKPRPAGRVRNGVAPDRAKDQQRLYDRLVSGDEIEAWRLTQQLLVSSASPEDLYLEVLGPALHMVGEAWAAGTITVAEEHRASAVMYRLVGRLGPLFIRRGRNRGEVVLGAPAGDYHGLATALVADVLRGRRFAVVDLGGSTPAESFVEAVASSPRLVGVGIVASAPVEAAAIAETIRLIKAATERPVLLGGVAIGSRDQARALGADGWSRSAREAVDWFETVTH